MANYDGYVVNYPNIDFDLLGASQSLDEVVTIFPNVDVPLLGASLAVDEVSVLLTNPQTTSIIGASAELDSIPEITAIVTNPQLTFIIGASTELDSVPEIPAEIIFNTGTSIIKKIPFYNMRAQDSGLTSPGFVYWSNYTADYLNSPTPVGTLSNLCILDIKMVSSLVSV